MKKEKLAPKMQMQLKGLSLEEKVVQAQAWHADGLISRALLEELTNRWHTKASKKALGCQVENSLPTRTCVQGEMRSFTNLLKSRLNKWLSDRVSDVRLSADEIVEFQKYLKLTYIHRNEVNTMVIIGLRYPDARLNELCEEFIEAHRKNRNSDFDFWMAVWSDAHIVPMNAVRLMTNKTGQIEPCFDRDLIKLLIPKIKQQRDKEAQRLEWAESLNDAKSIARKQRRLQSFNALLNNACRYIVSNQ
jgi:hypothetical protein